MINIDDLRRAARQLHNSALALYRQNNEMMISYTRVYYDERRGLAHKAKQNILPCR